MLINVRTNKLENSENGVKGLATVTFGDAFKVQSIAIMEGKNGLFVSMPSYKSKQVDEDGKAVYKDICNPITKGFRDQLYGAILSSFENEREATIGEADGRTTPNYGIKVTPLENAGNTVGIARIYLEDAFVVGNVSIKKTNDGKLFASMPSFKTNQVDENGKAVYKDICYPANKEFRQELQKAVINAYLETTVGIEQPDHATQPHKGSYEQAVEAGLIQETKGNDGFVPGVDEELPFGNGLQDPAEKKPEKAEAKKPEAKKEKSAEKKAEKPKSIKERLAEGEAKKNAHLAEHADKTKASKKETQIA